MTVNKIQGNSSSVKKLDVSSFFGKKIAINDNRNTALVSSFSKRTIRAGDLSGVYALSESCGVWDLDEVLSSPTGNFFFGEHTAISKNGLVAVVSDNKFGGYEDAGVAHVYTHGNNGWGIACSLETSDEFAKGIYYSDIAISDDGNRIILGGISNIGKSVLPGRVYVFDRFGLNWLQNNIITGYNSGYFSKFGEKVAMSADGKIIAVAHSPKLKHFSQVAIYKEKENEWIKQAVFSPIMELPRTNYGNFLTMSPDGRYLAIEEAYLLEDKTKKTIIHIYEGIENQWLKNGTIELPTEIDESVGISAMEINSNALAVTANFYSDTGIPVSCMLVYRRQGSAWNKVHDCFKPDRNFKNLRDIVDNSLTMLL